MPTKAVSHIQNNAPGPPNAIAVATPAILPVPIVAESEVIRALNGLISPSFELDLRPLHKSLNAVTTWVIVIPFKPMLK